MKCQEDEVNKVFQKYTKVIQICFLKKKTMFEFIFLCPYLYLQVNTLGIRRAVCVCVAVERSKDCSSSVLRFLVDTSFVKAA